MERWRQQGRKQPVEQARPPSQLPPQAPPHTLPSLVHFVRLPCGAPEVSVVQVPGFGATSHAWH